MGVFYDVRVHLADFPEDMDLRDPIIRNYMILAQYYSLTKTEKLYFNWSVINIKAKTLKIVPIPLILQRLHNFSKLVFVDFLIDLVDFHTTTQNVYYMAIYSFLQI